MFILENVKGFTTLKDGACHRAVLESLHGISSASAAREGSVPASNTIVGDGKPLYRIFQKVINTKDHGVPQHRERWYCIGVRRDADNDKAFKFPPDIGYGSIQALLQSEDELKDCRRTVTYDNCSAAVKDNIDRAFKQSKRLTKPASNIH